MIQYDDVPGHPLAGVPPEILRAARAVLGQARDVDLHDTDDRNALADAVTLALRQSGHLTWHTWRPPTDRESLVTLTNEVINAYLTDENARRRGTVVEAVIDRVVLPLLYPVEVPDRESLVLACQAAAAWRPDEDSSVMEAVVDQVIIPLLRRSNRVAGTTDTTDEGGGVRRPDTGT